MNMHIEKLVPAALASAVVVSALARPVHAQVLHTNDRWDECAIVIDPALTRASWHQFVSEVGLVAYFRPVASARPLGPRNFEVAVLDWGTRIDAADDAWNDTFSHPHDTHYLFEGDALMIPGLMARVGVTDRIDAGIYFTNNAEANYGFIGGQLQYGFVNDAERNLFVAGRISAVDVYGPEDLDVGVYGMDVVASKDLARLSPYVGIGGYWSRGHEKTTKVDLGDESVLGVQGTVGVALRLWALRIGAEATLAEVSGYSFKIAFGS